MVLQASVSEALHDRPFRGSIFCMEGIFCNKKSFQQKNIKLVDGLLRRNSTEISSACQNVKAGKSSLQPDA
jgi:hypothetical protein